MLTWKTTFRDILIFLLIGFIISVIFEGGKVSMEASFWWNVVYSSILCYFLVIGNTYIFVKLDEKIPWIETPVKRLVVQLFLHTFYSGTIILILNIILLLFIYSENYSRDYFATHLKSNLIVGLIITVFVLLIIQGGRFFTNWKNSLIKAERLEKEKTLTQYQALRAQVNPHFLFNSLNTLSGLISQDPLLADKYLGKLSEVYRYVLANQDKEVISLEEELTFIHSYLYLLNIRYNDQITWNTPNKSEIATFFIIPLGLQILVENAIKHNRISDKEPLSIDIWIEENEIIVENEKRLRNNPEDSLGKGLQNLVDRYGFLSRKKVEIKETETKFRVKIPLLTYEDHYH